MKRLLLLLVLALLLATACSTEQVAGVQTLVAALPDAQNSGPLGGAVAELPTPAPGVTATPPSSAISLLDTPEPTPLPGSMGAVAATLTAMAPAFVMEIDDTPYEMVMDGRPHFVEFQARW